MSIQAIFHGLYILQSAASMIESVSECHPVSQPHNTDRNPIDSYRIPNIGILFSRRNDNRDASIGALFFVYR